MYVPDLLTYHKHHETVPGTYVVFFSMMDTTPCDDDAWIIRAFKSAEIETIEEMAASLAFVITSFVILPPSAEAIGFEGPGGRQWDLNIDTRCRRLHHHSITSVQPHP